jgi:hypothetical protein
MTRVSPSTGDRGPDSRRTGEAAAWARRAPDPPSDQAIHGKPAIGARPAVPEPWAFPSLLVANVPRLVTT